MLERGIKVDHATLNRWVFHYSPKLEAMHQLNKPVTGTSIRMDGSGTKKTTSSVALHQAQLCRQAVKVFVSRAVVSIFILPFSQHVTKFDACQGCHR